MVGGVREGGGKGGRVREEGKRGTVREGEEGKGGRIWRHGT